MATDYYVSSAGSDAANGTSTGTSWRTISKVNGSTFSAGDRILFNRGDMWREQLTIPSSGAAGNPITFGAYGTGAQPIINCANVTTGWTNAGSNQWWVNNPNSTFTNQAMINLNGTLYDLEQTSLVAVDATREYYIDVAASPDRIYVYSTVDPGGVTTEVSARLYGIVTAAGASSKKHIVIENIEVRYAGRVGVYFEGPGQSTSDALDGDAIVQNCTFYANRTHGCASSDHYDNCLFQNNTGSFNGNGFYAWVSDEITIKNNTHSDAIHYSIGAGFTDGGGMQGYQSDNCLIEGNISHRDFDAIHIDAGNLPINATIRYNKAYDARFGSGGDPNTGTYGFGNVAAGGTMNIYYNLGVNGASSGIECYSTILGTVNLYNNTFYADATHATDGLVYFINTTNINVRNNIFVREYVSTEYTFVKLGSGQSGVQDYNLYYFLNAGANPKLRNYYNAGTSTTLGAWQTATGKDAASLNADPLLVNVASDWKLQSSSPAINAGTSVGLTRDIDGNAIVGAPDMGAYEYTVAPAAGPGMIIHRKVITH